MIHTGVGIPADARYQTRPNRSALSLKPVLIGLPLVYTMVAAQQQHHHQGGDESLHAAFRHNHPVTAPIAAPNARAAATATSAFTSMPTIDCRHRAGERQQGTDGQVDPRQICIFENLYFEVECACYLFISFIIIWPTSVFKNAHKSDIFRPKILKMVPLQAQLISFKIYLYFKRKLMKVPKKGKFGCYLLYAQVLFCWAT